MNSRGLSAHRHEDVFPPHRLTRGETVELLSDGHCGGEVGVPGSEELWVWVCRVMEPPLTVPEAVREL